MMTTNYAGSIRTIWKYTFAIYDHVRLSLPKGAQILRVAMQDREPTIWALVDPSTPLETVELRVFGTGFQTDATEFENLHHRLHYLGTVDDGPLVWHVFQKVPAVVCVPLAGAAS
jgi:hypothetical protein